MNKALTWFMYIWVSLVFLLNLIAVVGMFITSDSIWEGIKQVQHTYSPYNIINYGLNVVLISPAIGAYVWIEKRKNKNLN